MILAVSVMILAVLKRILAVLTADTVIDSIWKGLLACFGKNNHSIPHGQLTVSGWNNLQFQIRIFSDPKKDIGTNTKRYWRYLQYKDMGSA
jgi:hypothetical protein